MTRTRRRGDILSATVIMSLVHGAHAAPIVTNGGFETGDLSAWTIGGVADPSASSTLASSGTWSARGGCIGAACVTFGPAGVGGPGRLSQAVVLSPGIYRLSYDQANPATSATDQFAVSLGANVLRNTVADSAHGFQPYSHVSAVSGGSTVLAFGMRDDPSYLYVDNVALVQIDDGAGNNIAALAQAAAFGNTYGFLDRLHARFGHAGSPVGIALNTPVQVADATGGYVGPNGSVRAWMSAYGDRSRWDAGTRARHWGLTAGIDTAVADGLDMGVGFAAGSSRFSTQAAFTDNTGQAAEYLASVYFHFSPAASPLYVTAAAGYGYTESDLARTSPTFGTLVARDVGATQWLGTLEAGYDWNVVQGLWVTPFLRGDAVRLRQDAYVERVIDTSILLPMSVAEVEQDALRTILGARAAIDLAVGRRGARLSTTLGWAHEFETDRIAAFSHTSLTNPAGGTNVTFAGVATAGAPATDSVIFGAGVEAPLTDAARIHVGYNGLFASGVDSHAVEAGLRVGW